MRMIARWLIRLYPPRWQERYGDEFMAMLDERPCTLRTIADIARCAVSERVRTARSTGSMLGAIAATTGAVASFYWAVPGTEFHAVLILIALLLLAAILSVKVSVAAATTTVAILAFFHGPASRDVTCGLALIGIAFAIRGIHRSNA